MKKIIYLLAILVITFSSCNPLEDIHNEIDAIPDAPNVGSFVYTLVDADYTALNLNFGNFSNEADAKEKLPGFLATKYALYGEGSDANVTFKIYAPKFDEKSLKIYEVTRQDYTDNGHRFGNFDSFSDISEFLDVKYPNAPNRMLVSLTYKYYTGTTATLENGFIKVNGVWEMSTGITDAEYTAMGEGRAQFSNETEALQKIPVFLKDRFKYEGKVAGDIEGIMYKLYVTDTQDVDEDGRTDDRTVYSFVAFFIYDGADWSKYSNVKNASIKFGNDGTKWVPDNTIRYTLMDSDYTYIGTEFTSKYAEPSASVKQYKNFDRRPSNGAYWSDAMLLEATGKLLDNVLASSAAEGQQYVLTFDIYDGGSGTEELKVIKTNGAWVLNN